MAGRALQPGRGPRGLTRTSLTLSIVGRHKLPRIDTKQIGAPQLHAADLCPI